MTGGDVYIYGAHSRAQTLKVYLTTLNPDYRVRAFIVGNDEKNSDEIDGIPVIHLEEHTELNWECPIYIGTRGVYHEEITKRLSDLGAKTIIPVTYELDLDLRNRYLKKVFKEAGREFCKIDDLKSVANNVVGGQTDAQVYVASSGFDKPLASSYDLASYETILQVGASLTDRREDAQFFDNAGDTISIKNSQFCELTGLYWIWKNAQNDITGLVHYRRHFLLPDDWLSRMLEHGVDVILPVPLFVAPNLEDNFKMRHVPKIWDVMLSYVKERYPEEYAPMCSFFRENGLYSPCNMLIAKKEVLDALCEWLFPILFYVEGQVGQLEDKYQNRYPGFLSERLISYFFEKKRDVYKVVYADKNFLA